jgi:hypothetical protein
MVEWYVALIESQQSAWYEPSDWALARLWCDIMSAAWARDGYPSAALIGRWQVATTGLLTTEGDRRRLRIELARQKPTKVEKAAGNATVLRLAEHSRLGRHQARREVHRPAERPLARAAVDADDGPGAVPALVVRGRRVRPVAVQPRRAPAREGLGQVPFAA